MKSLANLIVLLFLKVSCGIIPPRKSIEHSLLILRLDGIGDSILFNVVLKDLSNFFSDYKKDIIVRDYVEDLYLNCPYINEIIPFSMDKAWKNILYRIRLVIKIYKRGYNTIIYPMWSNNFLGDLICNSTSSKVVYKFENSLPNKFNFVNIKTNALKEIDRYKIFAEKIIGTKIIENNSQFWVPEDTKIRMEKFINENLENKYLIFFPGALYKIRILDNFKMAGVIIRINFKGLSNCLFWVVKATLIFVKAYVKDLNKKRLKIIAEILILTSGNLCH